MEITEFYDEVYRFPWIVCIGGSKDEAYSELLKRLGLPEDVDGVDMGKSGDGAFLANTRAKGGAIWLIQDKSDVSTIVHECYHATNYVLQSSGVDPATENNDEHYAYYMQWIFKKVYNIWIKEIEIPTVKKEKTK